MLALVSIAISACAVCVLPFMVSGLLAVHDRRRGRYRLTGRVCQVAAILTVLYSLAIWIVQSPMTIATADELFHWLLVVALLDLALMCCVGVFSLLGYLAGSKWGRSRTGEWGRSQLRMSEVTATVAEETGNPYQIPRG